jgi:tetratricopeptide (TPR) repeat protein
MAKGLKPVQRVKKKEIKEDKLVTTYFQARDYYNTHKKNFLRIGGSAIALIVLIVFWVQSRGSAEYDAAYELGVALTTIQQTEPSAIAGQFEQISDRYQGTTAGNEAMLYAAQMKRTAGNLEEAMLAYDNYIRNGKKDLYLYPAALVGKAACLEDLGRYEEAAESYLKGANTHRDFFATPRYLLDAARCYKAAGMSEQAKQQYEIVASNYQDTDFAVEAEKELKRI